MALARASIEIDLPNLPSLALVTVAKDTRGSIVALSSQVTLSIVTRHSSKNALANVLNF